MPNDRAETRAGDRSKSEGTARKVRGLLVALAALAAAYGLVGRWQAMTDVPRFFIGMYGMSAWNHLKYGYADFGLAQIVTPGPVVERSQRQYYVTHPPMVTWLSSFSLAAFGREVWAARLPHFLASLAAVAVLGLFAARLYGTNAGLWTAAVTAALPGAVKGGALTDPLGPAFVLLVSLAALFYHQYSKSGRRRDFWLLAGVSVLAVFTDWPAYIMCFALAAHAVVYRTKARKAAMLVLPAVAAVVFAVLLLYARSIPEEGHVFESLGQQLGKLSVGEAGEAEAKYSLAQWGVDFTKKFVLLLSPFALLAAAWAAWRLPRAALTRENRPDQHLLLLWLWPLPFVVAFHRFFYLNVYCFLVFVPAVAVTLGALAARLTERGAARWAAGVICLGFLILWSQYARTMEEGTADLQRLRVAWAADLAKHTAPDQESAFAGHYARQMRFLADRRVRERIDSMAKVEGLRSQDKEGVTLLFVPIAFPCGDATFGRDLVARYPVEAGAATMRFLLASPRQAREVAVRRPAGIGLDKGVRIKTLSVALVAASEGRKVLYVGLEADGLPRAHAGESVEWVMRFVRGDGARAGETAMPAEESASYFVEVPKGWSAEAGRVEIVLRHNSTDADSVGRLKRLERFVLRFLTFRALGNPRARTREFLVGGKAPLALPGL